jgi:hypothetical protein
MQYIFDIIKENYDVPYLTLDSDFSDIVKNNISKLPSTDIINLYIGDILEQEYPEKIEIMFLDVCKTDKVNFAMQKLFSRLIPGKSILIQEDYIHGWHPYIKLTMGYLAAGEYFEFLGCVSPSLVWLLKKPIPPDVLAINPYEEFSKYLKMFFYWNKVLTPPQALVVLASLSNSGAVTDIMMEACLREYEKHL